jgi:hypothetical protein
LYENERNIMYNKFRLPINIIMFEGGIDMYKKRLVVLLLIVMVLNLLGMGNVYGQNAISTDGSLGKDFHVTFGRVTGEAGKEVVVPITFYNVPKPGIASCFFSLEYDNEVLEYEYVEAGAIVTQPLFNFAFMHDNNKMSFLFHDPTNYGYEPIVSDGVFAYIKFKIKKTSSSGAYSIKLKESHDILDSNYKNISTQFIDGYVLVYQTETSIPDYKFNVDVEIGKVEGEMGKEVAVPIKFNSLPEIGINNCNFVLEFDSKVLEVKRVEAGSIVSFPLGNFNCNTSEAGRMNFLYNDETAGAMPIIKSGVFAQIIFKVKENVKRGIYGINKISTGSFSAANKGKLISLSSTFSDGYVAIGKPQIETPTNTPTNTPTSTPADSLHDLNVSIGQTVAAPGEKIIVPITFNNISSIGINNCDFIVGYDNEKLELVGVEAGDIVPLPEMNFSYNKSADGQINFVFADETQSQMPIVSDGLFARIKFKVKDGVQSGIYNVFKFRIGAFSGLSSGILKPIDVKFNDGFVKIEQEPTGTPVVTSTSIATPTPGLIKNPSFSEGTKYWYFWTDDRGDATGKIDPSSYYSESNSYSIKIKDPGTKISSIQLFTKEVSLESGKLYKLSFCSKASERIKLPSILLMEAQSPWTAYSVSKSVEVGTEWSKNEVYFKSYKTDSNGRLTFFLGKSIPSGVLLNLDTIELNEVDANSIPEEELKLLDINNTDSGKDRWHFWTDSGGSALFNTYTNSYGSVCASVYSIDAGTQMSSVQLFKYGINLKAGSVYNIKFRAKSTSEFTIPYIGLMKADVPWSAYCTPMQSGIGTDWKEYAYIFRSSTSDTNGRLTFFLGKSLPKGAVFNIEDLSIEEMEEY